MNTKQLVWSTVQWLIVSLMSFGVISPIFAQNLHFGIGGGAYLPTGDAEELFQISPGIHGKLLAGLKNTIKFEGEFGYWILQDGLDADDFSASFYVFTGGIRLYPFPSVHLDAGGGMYRSDFEWNAKGVRVDESETNAGVYGGLGFELGAFDLTARAHVPDFDDFYIGAILTYLFDISKLFKH